MKIFKYDESTSTKLTQIEVDDSHVLADDELATLPNDFYTPAKLVNGKLVGSTLEESNAFYGVTEYETKPSATQQQLAMMNMQIAQLMQNNTALTKLIMAQNTQISKMKGAN